MKTFIVHNPCNEFTKQNRYYNFFWDKLTDNLKEKYNIIENRYFEDAHKDCYPVQLKRGTHHNFCLHECEYVIEDVDTGEIYIMSVVDNMSVAIINEANNPLLKIVLVAQYNQYKIDTHVFDNAFKYSPWIYFPSINLDLEQYFEKRKTINDFVDRLYFRGSGMKWRPMVYHLSDILTGPDLLLSNHYFDELITHKIGLSVSGTGEFCYRDVEYMAIGVPFLRFEYQTKMKPELIPNYHYISVPLPEDLPKENDIPIDRLGNIHHADMLRKRFIEVKDDKDFLDFVSTNARNYYEEYLSLDNSIRHTLNLLNL